MSQKILLFVSLFLVSFAAVADVTALNLNVNPFEKYEGEYQVVESHCFENNIAFDCKVDVVLLQNNCVSVNTKIGSETASWSECMYERVSRDTDSSKNNYSESYFTEGENEAKWVSTKSYGNYKEHKHVAWTFVQGRRALVYKYFERVGSQIDSKVNYFFVKQ